MRSLSLIGIVAVAMLSGCSTTKLAQPDQPFKAGRATIFPSPPTESTKVGSGDAGPYIVQNAILFGGHPVTTNGLPPITGVWHYGPLVNLTSSNKSDPGFAFILALEDCEALHDLLEKAFGKKVPEKTDPNTGARSGVYKLNAKGAVLFYDCNAEGSRVVLVGDRASRFNSQNQLESMMNSRLRHR